MPDVNVETGISAAAVAGATAAAIQDIRFATPEVGYIAYTISGTLARVAATINGGATWSGGTLVVADVPNYLVLSAGVWSLSDVSGDTIPRGAWRRLQGSSVRLDAGEYQYCIDTSGGLLTLNEVDGVATLEDPE